MTSPAQRVAKQIVAESFHEPYMPRERVEWRATNHWQHVLSGLLAVAEDEPVIEIDEVRNPLGGYLQRATITANCWVRQ